jgi:hypothetical protein
MRHSPAAGDGVGTSTMESSWAGFVVMAMLGNLRVVVVVDIVMVWFVRRYADNQELAGVCSKVSDGLRLVFSTRWMYWKHNIPISAQRVELIYR